MRGSVQFNGDVAASANAAIVLSAGSGSVPSLALAGNSGGIQNISASNGTTLTLPALAISAGTVNVGNSSGYNGSVVLSASTSLSGANSTLNVNAGTLKVSSTLSGAAGVSVQVNWAARSPAARRPASRSR